MKFYRDKNNNNNYFWQIKNNNLTAIYRNYYSVWFFEKGSHHNIKNFAYNHNNAYKQFRLNGKLYGYKDDFTKQSWRRFVKLQAFL